MAEAMRYQTMTYTAEDDGIAVTGLPHLFQFSVFPLTREPREGRARRDGEPA
jgi:hypothetical protein